MWAQCFATLVAVLLAAAAGESSAQPPRAEPVAAPSVGQFSAQELTELKAACRPERPCDQAVVDIRLAHPGIAWRDSRDISTSGHTPDGDYGLMRKRSSRGDRERPSSGERLSSTSHATSSRHGALAHYADRLDLGSLIGHLWRERRCRRARSEVAGAAAKVVRQAFADAHLVPDVDQGDSLLLFIARSAAPSGAMSAAYRVEVDLADFPRVAPSSDECRAVVRSSFLVLVDPPRHWLGKPDEFARVLAERVRLALDGLN